MVDRSPHKGEGQGFKSSRHCWHLWPVLYYYYSYYCIITLSLSLSVSLSLSLSHCRHLSINISRPHTHIGTLALSAWTNYAPRRALSVPHSVSESVSIIILMLQIVASLTDDSIVINYAPRVINYAPT